MKTYNLLDFFLGWRFWFRGWWKIKYQYQGNCGNQMLVPNEENKALW